MNLASLLKIARLFGLELADIRRLVNEQGIPAARDFIEEQIRKRVQKKKVAILKNLATKAPLDGQKRRDLDGIEMNAAQFFTHEGLYLQVKAVLRRGGLAVDGVRDVLFPKVWALVESDVANINNDPAELFDLVQEAALEVVF